MLHEVIQGPRFLLSCASPIFWVLRICPCPFSLPHVTADGETEGVESHTGSQGPDLQEASITSALFLSARTFHWSTVLSGGLEKLLLHGLRKKCIVSAPSRLSLYLCPRLVCFGTRIWTASFKSSTATSVIPVMVIPPQTSKKQADGSSSHN